MALMRASVGVTACVHQPERPDIPLPPAVSKTVMHGCARAWPQMDADSPFESSSAVINQEAQDEVDYAGQPLLPPRPLWHYAQDSQDAPQYYPQYGATQQQQQQQHAQQQHAQPLHLDKRLGYCVLQQQDAAYGEPQQAPDGNNAQYGGAALAQAFFLDSAPTPPLGPAPTSWWDAPPPAVMNSADMS